MIKRIILFVFLLSGVSALPLASDGGDTIEIVITDTGGVPSSPTHRTPSRIPLECYYDSGMNCVLVKFKSSVGEVMIDLYNSMTGESVNVTVLANGTQIIPCPGDDGYCTITFILSNGKQYFGDFLL